MITTRFPFVLGDGTTDLTKQLCRIQLSEFQAPAHKKLQRRQVDHLVPVQQGHLEHRLLLLELAENLAGKPGLQDLLGAKLVLNSSVPVARVETILTQLAEYRNGKDLPADSELRKFLLNLEVVLGEADNESRDLLRAITIFDMPVPAKVVDTHAAAIGGSTRRLGYLGLLDAYDDGVGESLSANSLATSRVVPLSDTERTAIAKLAAPALFDAFGREAGVTRAPFPCASSSCAWDCLRVMRKSY